MRARPAFPFLLAALVPMAAAAAPVPPSPAPGPRIIGLPGAPATGVGMDYIAHDPARHRVWVPAGNTGRVDVIDTVSGAVTEVPGFPTREFTRDGRTRTAGPSSVALGDGVAYVGNRGDDSVCLVDAASLQKGACAKLPSMPDALAVVAASHEVWVTTPRTSSIVVLDTSRAGALAVKQTFTTPGEPECLLTDARRGVVYTNLEDRDRTLALDVKTRAVVHTWEPRCGEKGPRGLALDGTGDALFVACTDRVQVLDAAHEGRLLSSMPVGEGVDAIDYVSERKELVAAAGGAGVLVIGGFDGRTLTAKTKVATAPGARNAVAAEGGAVYVTDSRRGAILVVEPPR
jgi:DNA-binding beta-propeller fold protein YncE